MDSYNESINFLYSLQKHGIKLGLSNTLRLMRILDSPHKKFRTIHIAGTNGKGSTAAAIASILNESGFRTGLFMSPHLISFTERISVNNKRISENEVIGLTAEIRDLISGTDLNPTFFEFVTAMAFYYFSLQDVEFAVVETGMGGRLDATNVIEPDIAIITNIGLDHCEFLGNSISEITYEKAGIIKHGIPVLTASSDPGVISQLSVIAKEKNAELNLYGRDFNGSINRIDPGGIDFNYTGECSIRDISVPLSGEYQLFNMCLAIRACEFLRKKGVLIPDNSLIAGLRSIRLEGRLERLSDDPLIIIDGAHNPDAAFSLSSTIRSLYPDNRLILIAGIMDDKNISGILEPMVRIADSVILTKARYDRAASAERLNKAIAELLIIGQFDDKSGVVNTSSVEEALTVAKSVYRDNDVILISGSFYTTGEAKELLGFKAVLSKLRE